MPLSEPTSVPRHEGVGVGGLGGCLGYAHIIVQIPGKLESSNTQRQAQTRVTHAAVKDTDDLRRS